MLATVAGPKQAPSHIELHNQAVVVVRLEYGEHESGSVGKQPQANLNRKAQEVALPNTAPLWRIRIGTMCAIRDGVRVINRGINGVEVIVGMQLSCRFWPGS